MTDDLRLHLVLARYVVYLILFVYTLCKYRKRIQKLNKCLLWSWAFEAILRNLSGVLLYNGYYKTQKIIYYIWWTLSEINFMIFLTIIFRLKALQIYMDINNDTEQKIKSQFRRLRVTRVSYLAIYVVIVVF